MYPKVLKIIMATGFPGKKYPTMSSVMTLRIASQYAEYPFEDVLT